MKITIRLDKRYRLSNGKFPVKIALARNGKTFYIPINLEIGEKDWDAKAKNMEYVKNLPNRKALNLFIRGEFAKAEQRLRDLQLAGRLREMSDKELLNYLSSNRTEKKEMQFFWYYAEKFISERKTEGTKEVYKNAITVLSQNYDYKNLKLSDIDSSFIAEYQKKLNARGLKSNTVDNYISRLRSIYRFAYDSGATDRPFPTITIHKETTVKRSLLIEQLRQLKTIETTKIQKKYIDLFFLILYMRGINMADLAQLPVDAIKNGRITYIRNKTGRSYEIKIEPEMEEIINRYKGTKHLLCFFDNRPPAYYKTLGNNLGHTIRSAARTIGVSAPLSAYWARHSWATLAIEIGGTMEITSAGLGHSVGIPVTNVYVAFRQKQIDELSRRVIDYVLQKGEYSING